METDLTPEQQAEIDKYIAQGGLAMDEAVAGGARVTAGRAVVRLIAGEAKLSTSKKYMVAARFEVKQHEDKNNVGLDYIHYYSLAVSPPKKPGQKPLASGIIEMLTHFSTAEAPYTGRVPFHEPDKCWKLVAKHLGKKELDVIFYEDLVKGNPNSPDERKQKDSTFLKMRVLGVHKGGAIAAAKPTAKPAPILEEEAEEEEDLV